MGTAQVAFAVVELRLWSYRKWRQSRDRKWPRPEEALSGSMFCACATGSWAISAIVGSRKWRQSRDQSRDRKRLCPEVITCATGSCATVSRVFSTLVVVLWLPKVIRRVCATGGCATGSWLQEVRVPAIFPRFFLTLVVQKVGVFSTTSASYI